MSFGHDSDPYRRETVDGMIWGAVLCLVIVGFGILGFHELIAPPLLGWLRCRRGTPCQIVASEVVSAEFPFTGYQPALRYRYEFNGQTYHGEVYSFAHDESWGLRSAREVVKQYPEGRETVCYVNPADPSEAALDRTFPTMMAVFIPLPGLFVVGGIFGVFVAIRKALRIASGG